MHHSDADAAAAPRIRAISVAYRSERVIGTMLRSLPAGTETVIVENGADDPAALAEVARGAGATLRRPGANLGFGGGCNLGAEGAAREFLFFVNPDAALAPGCLAALVAALDADPGLGAANPVIWKAPGRPLLRRRSRLSRDPAETLPKGLPAASRDVFVLSGAALIVRRTAFEAVGGFDPAIFLFHEDDDLCLRLRAAGHRLGLVRAAELHHAGGESSRPSAALDAFKAWHLGASRVAARRKHGWPRPRLATVLETLNALRHSDTYRSPAKRAEALGVLRGALGIGGGGRAPE
ncbi:glycosyltransferase family 2 protein [Roseivivax sp. CAU 1761]